MSLTRGVVVASATALALIFVSAAMADGTYTVLSCTGPAGVFNAAAGWTMTPPASGAGVATNTCLAGGSLNAALAGPQLNGNASASWQFAAPANTRIVRFGATRTTTGVVQGTAPTDVEYVLAGDTGTLESCLVSDTSSCVGDLTGTIDKQGLSTATVGFRVLCTNAGAFCTRPLRADFTNVAIGLDDPAAPTVAAQHVLDDGSLSGVLSATFDAGDAGGGVYRAIVKVDGQVFRTQPLAPAPCTDAIPGDADPYQFTQPVPCPLSLTGAAVKLDYHDLPAGPHAVEIDVEDAAGNATPIYGPVDFPQLNTEVKSNTAAAVQRAVHAHLRMWFHKGHGHTLRSPFGTRVVTRGRLTDPAGHGIQGARIDVYHLLHGRPAKLIKTGLKTRKGGALTLILPLDLDTRRIEFDYRALRPGNVTSRQLLTLKVYRHGKEFFRQH